MPSRVFLILRSLSGILAAIFVLGACQQTKIDTTSLVIEVRSNLSADDVDQLYVLAEVTEPVARSFTVDSDHGFPFRFGLTPAHSSSDVILIDVTALKGSTRVANVSIETTFTPGVVRTVVVELDDEHHASDGGTQSVDAIEGCAEGTMDSCDCGGSGRGLRRCTGRLWSPCVATCADTGLFGQCSKGARTCDETQAAPTWGACSIPPQAKDSCEPNADENCNGTQNEGCPCTRGAKRSCADGGLFGTCASGSQTCNAQGSWDKCTVSPTPKDTCTAGNDDNCNGAKNEGCECVANTRRTCASGGLSGRCASGSQTCSAEGHWGTCSIAPLAKDTCADGNDDNCNGRPNEGCPCVNGNLRSCSAGGLSGRCANGTQTCAGGMWSVCSVMPLAADSCLTGNDDNCNGRPNEGCACFATSVRTCGSGGAQGRCAFGTQTCSTAGQWSGCTVSPSATDSCESNDNDDNCNGIKAEGCKCVAKSLACNGSKFERCSDDGKSVASEECGLRGCDVAIGGCGGECVPPGRRCNDQSAEICSPEGKWNFDRLCSRCENSVCRDCDYDGQRMCWDEGAADFRTGAYTFKTCTYSNPHLVWSSNMDCSEVCVPDPSVCH